MRRHLKVLQAIRPPRTSLCFVCAILLGAMAISLFARAAFVGTA